MTSNKTLLDEIMENIKEEDIDIQMKELSNSIQNEEDNKGTGEGFEFRPDHSNIFLVFEIKSLINTQYNYLTLEREMPGKYIIGLWTKNKNSDKPSMRTRVWDINEVKPKKIITEFAKTYKLYC